MFITLLENLTNYKYIIDSRSILAKSLLTLFQFYSTMSDNLLFNNTANILYTILSSVIGLQVLHFHLSPFLYTGHKIPSSHRAGSSFSIAYF